MKTQGTGENDEGWGRKRQNGRVNQMKKGSSWTQNADYRMFHSIQYVDISLRDWYKSHLNQAEVPNF